MTRLIDSIEKVSIGLTKIWRVRAGGALGKFVDGC